MEEAYTITKQYHEKKDIDIYVVRLIEKVDTDTFDELKSLAKTNHGYYSSFRGVNGFVFKTNDDAESFVSEMSDLVGLETLSSMSCAEENTIKPVKQKKSKSKVEPKSHMPLHEALRYIVETEGTNILSDTRLVNILDDFHAFDELPNIKYILRALIVDGATLQLLSQKDWNSVESKFKMTTGFIPEMVSYIFQSLSYGLCHTDTIPAFTINREEASIVINVSQTPSKRNHPEKHLKFKDTDIAGTPNSFAKKLTKKGFEEDVWCDDFFTMEGTFAGVSGCKLWVHFNKTEDVVYRVKVEFPWYQNRKRVANDYKKLKKSLQELYGKPVCDMEDFTQDWSSKYTIPQGIIILTCFPGDCPQVTIDYYDGYYDNHHGEIVDDVAIQDL